MLLPKVALDQTRPIDPADTKDLSHPNILSFICKVIRLVLFEPLKTQTWISRDTSLK